MAGFASLSGELFLEIIRHLPPSDLVLCRRVCRTWHTVFTQADFCLESLKRHFPRCREMRLAAALDGVRKVPAATEAPAKVGNVEAAAAAAAAEAYDNFELLLELELGRQPAWPTVFAKVARRYHHLRAGTPRRIERFALAPNADGPAGLLPVFRFQGVAPWAPFLELEDRSIPFHYPEPLWTYSPEDGLLVYPAPLGSPLPDFPPSATPERIKEGNYYPYRIRDLETGHEVLVPFHTNGRIVFRVRLADGVLVFEWADPMLSIRLDEAVYRVSFYNVSRVVATPRIARAFGGDDGPALWSWDVAYWVSLDLGYWPLDDTYRFLSVHTATRFVIYRWCSNHHPLVASHYAHVWNLSSFVDTDGSPGYYAQLATQRLFYTDGPIDPQQVRPTLRGLALDEGSLYFSDEDHCWAAGPEASLVLPPAHFVRTIAIPLVPPNFTAPQGSDDQEAEGPAWKHCCGAGAGELSASLCRGRADGSSTNYYASRAASGGPLCPYPKLQRPDPTSLPRADRLVWAGGEGEEEAAQIPPQPPTQTLSSSSNYPFRRRNPAAAPCWRHEDFPYLTVAEAVDLAAGVRAVARRSVLMEVASKHVRPTVSIAGVGSDSSKRRGAHKHHSARGQAEAASHEDDGMDMSASDGDSPSGGDRADEAQLDDDMWPQLMGKGYIAGDERWIVGEHEDGRSITVLRF